MTTETTHNIPNQKPLKWDPIIVRLIEHCLKK